MTAVRLRPNPRWKAAGRTAVAPRVVSEAEHSAAVMLRHAIGANPQARDGARGAGRGESRKRRVSAHPGARRLCSGLGLKNLLDGPGGFFGRDTIGCGEIHAPEARRGREELDADALAFFIGLAQKDDAALLLFLREGIGEDDQQAVLERLVQINQRAVGVNDNGFAGLAELAAVGFLSRGHHAKRHEHARTASRLFVVDFSHREAMLRQLTAPALAQASPHAAGETAAALPACSQTNPSCETRD